MDKGGSEAEKEQKMRERDTRVAWNIRKGNKEEEEKARKQGKGSEENKGGEQGYSRD